MSSYEKLRRFPWELQRREFAPGLSVSLRLCFLGSKITADGDCSHEIKRRLLLGRKTMTNLDSILSSRDITLLTKVHLVKAMVFFSSHVCMWELDYKESWALMLLNCGVGEASWESLGLQGDPTSLISKGNVIGRTDAEAETPILWPPDAKNWLIGKDPDAGKGWRWEKGTTEDEMVRWHHRLSGHEFEQALGVGDREAWRAAVHGVAESWTQLSNWTELSVSHSPSRLIMAPSLLSTRRNLDLVISDPGDLEWLPIPNWVRQTHPYWAFRAFRCVILNQPFQLIPPSSRPRSPCFHGMDLTVAPWTHVRCLSSSVLLLLPSAACPAPSPDTEIFHMQGTSQTPPDTFPYNFAPPQKAPLLICLGFEWLICLFSGRL